VAVFDKEANIKCFCGSVAVSKTVSLGGRGQSLEGFGIMRQPSRDH
jgi:hypothetical protein